MSGYEDILKIIQDSGHEEYEEWMTRLGDDFNPEEFSVEETDGLLRRKNYRCIMLFAQHNYRKAMELSVYFEYQGK